MPHSHHPKSVKSVRTCRYHEGLSAEARGTLLRKMATSVQVDKANPTNEPVVICCRILRSCSSSQAMRVSKAGPWAPHQLQRPARQAGIICHFCLTPFGSSWSSLVCPSYEARFHSFSAACLKVSAINTVTCLPLPLPGFYGVHASLSHPPASSFAPVAHPAATSVAAARPPCPPRSYIPRAIPLSGGMGGMASTACSHLPQSLLAWHPSKSELCVTLCRGR